MDLQLDPKTEPNKLHVQNPVNIIYGGGLFALIGPNKEHSETKSRPRFIRVRIGKFR